MSNSHKALEGLAELWLQAKEAERKANAQRLEIEEMIIAITGHQEDGRETLDLPSGRKITVVGKLNYKGDILEIEALTATWPDTMQIVRYEPKLDEPKIRKIREMRPELWRKLAEHVTAKPAKTGIMIKEPSEDVV